MSGAWVIIKERVRARVVAVPQGPGQAFPGLEPAMRSLLAVLILTASLIGGPAMAIEQPKHQVERAEGKFELQLRLRGDVRYRDREQRDDPLARMIGEQHRRGNRRRPGRSCVVVVRT